MNPSKVPISSFRQRNGATGGTRYAAGDYLGQSITRHCQYPSGKSIISPTTVKTLVDLVYAPVIIGVFIIAVCIIGSVYVLNQWYYADFDLESISTGSPVSKLVESPTLLVSMDLSRLLASDAELDWKAAATTKPIQTQSETEPYELTPEDEALLLEHFRENLPPLRESPFGLGPYPKVPPDYPRQDAFDKIERYANASVGQTTIGHELIHRVLIKYWNQGKKTAAGVLDDDNGRVYPLFKDTVYVEWRDVELEDGSTRAYLESYLCHGSLADYEESVENGTQPSWLKVVRREDGGIDPYSFLDLP